MKRLYDIGQLMQEVIILLKFDHFFEMSAAMVGALSKWLYLPLKWKKWKINTLAD